MNCRERVRLCIGGLLCLMSGPLSAWEHGMGEPTLLGFPAAALLARAHEGWNALEREFVDRGNALPQLGEDPAGSTYYVDDTDGNDLAEGQSPGTAWRTIARVNSASLRAGDSVLLKRGGTWREPLIAQSGDESGYITYGAYGEGNKPLLLGSVARNSVSDWKYEGNNIWRTLSLDDESLETVGEELLPNPSFDTHSRGWGFHASPNAVATGRRDGSSFDSTPASYSIEVGNPGNSGSDIQFYARNITVEQGTLYLLTFRAQSSASFVIDDVRLMGASPPWSNYYSLWYRDSLAVDNEWKTYRALFKADRSAADARITFYLGKVTPPGTVFHIDTLSLRRLKQSDLLDRLINYDVGNIVFNGSEVGTKVFEEKDLKQPRRFWYDEEKRLVKMYSDANPASSFSDIELALGRNIIDAANRSYIVCENLDLRYGGQVAISNSFNHHVIIRNSDISYIGGSAMPYPYRAADGSMQTEMVRYGNAIQFWGDASDVLVEKNRIWEIFDTAISNQYRPDPEQTEQKPCSQYNITYRNNIVWNAEMAFEYWNRPATSVTHDIFFENNTCAFSGRGWSHNQRTIYTPSRGTSERGKDGRSVVFYSNAANTFNFFVRNNIFYESTEGGIRWADPKDVHDFIVDYNLWYQTSGPLAMIADKDYDLAAYRSLTGQDAHSLFADPRFTSPSVRDFHLSAGSPAIDRGVNNNVPDDFDGVTRPQGGSYDIGAYEKGPA